MTGYGSLKTSAERALGVYESSLDTYDDLFSIDTANGGTSTYDSVASLTVLATTTTSGSRVCRTTNRYHYYLPGTSNIIKQSIICGDTGKTNNKRRWGAFDDSDGLFFELNGTSLRLVIRTSTLGTPGQEFYIERSNWSDDKLDGTGISGVTLDLTKANNYWADYQWNGAGRVRFGIYEPSGARLVIHTIMAANTNGVPLVRSGTLPLRTENINTGATSSSSELREICMSVFTEGTFEDYTFWRHADVEVYDVATTTNTHLISMRAIDTINSKHNSVQAYPEMLSVHVTGGSIALFLWQDTSITGGTWVSGQGVLESNSSGTLDTSLAEKFQVFFLGAGSHNLDLTQYFELNDEGILKPTSGPATIWSFAATKIEGTTVSTCINLGYRELW